MTMETRASEIGTKGTQESNPFVQLEAAVAKLDEVGKIVHEKCTNFRIGKRSRKIYSDITDSKSQLENTVKTYKYTQKQTSNPLCVVTSGVGGFDSLALPPSILDTKTDKE